MLRNSWICKHFDQKSFPFLTWLIFIYDVDVKTIPVNIYYKHDVIEDLDIMGEMENNV